MATLVVITGPTAVGKTALCIKLAKHYGIPIINADSRQIYRELRIGTASPSDEQLREVKHYFVGSIGIDDYYNASLYEQDVLRVLDEQFCHSPIQLLTGGSMMYIDAVCNGIDDIPTIRDDIRNEMKRRYAEEGLEALCADLQRLDPEHYAVVDRKNYRRVIHALEICYQTGQTYTSFRKQERKQRPFRIVKIGLNRERDELYQRINARADKMMEDDGSPFTAHTTNPVPAIIVGSDCKKVRAGGVLADLAPTMLQLMGIPQPKEMTGKTLIEE